MGKALFITGTGTDIGKTYVTGLIVKKLRDAGLNGGYYKAALSGAVLDEKGVLHEHMVSFYEATTRAIMGLPIIDKSFNQDLGWKFLFSMKQNEYFVFPNEDTGFSPHEIDLTDQNNYSLISPNLFRVQKIANGDYHFRHHLETNVEDTKELKNISWKRINSPKYLSEIVKVRVNHLGIIVSVGEY